METAESETGTNCFYLLQGMRVCAIRPDGMYIPPRQHLLSYCLTQCHKQCPTYTRYCRMETASSNTEADNQAGRRHFPRIPKKYMVLVQTCDSIGVLRGNFAEQALTLDYGQGGMRILINRELPSDSLLRVDFGNDFLIPQLQGITKICWHRKLPNSPQGVEEAGLAFQDHFSQAVLQLNLSSNQ
jgi:hypothetical protein